MTYNYKEERDMFPKIVWDTALLKSVSNVNTKNFSS